MPQSDVTEISDDVSEPDEPEVRRTRPSVIGLASTRAVRWPLIIVGAALGLLLLTALSQHAVANNSDSSTITLEGYTMVHGNPLLHEWSLSLDSFWTVDAPFYAVGYLILGLRPILVNFVPALIGVLVIVLGACMARDGARGRAAFTSAAFVVLVLLFPSHALAYFFLQGPWHIGTALWCLLAFWGLRRGDFSWGWITAVALLAAGLLGDIQALALGVAPAAAAGLVAMARTRSWRRGAAPLSAALAAVAVAEAVREVALSIGTFTFSESHHTAKAAQAVRNLGHLIHWAAAMLGIDNGPYKGVHVPLVFELAHGLVAACILVALLVAGLGLLRGAIVGDRRGASAEGAIWRLDDLLVFGIAGDFVVFEVLTLSNNILYARYLTVGLIFSVVLAGRLLGRASHVLRSAAVARLAAIGAVAVVACFSVDLALELNAPLPSQPVSALDNFLLAHNLRSGVGDYWAASVVTVQSEGAIDVRPVVANLRKIIVPDGRQATATWYDRQHFQFLVYQDLPYGRVDAATVAGTFGTPKTTFTIGSYHVAVWNHPITVPGPAFP